MDVVEGHIAIDPPLGVPVWDIDPYDPSVLSTPKGYYTELRAKGLFAYIPKYAVLACGRYDVTREVFSDWERFVSSRGVGCRISGLRSLGGPEHRARGRSAVPRQDTKRSNRALSPKAVADLKEAFQYAARRLIDDLLARQLFDAIPDLAEAFPSRSFQPSASGDRSPAAGGLRSMVFNALGPDNEIRRSAMAKAPDIVPWITEHCRRDKARAGGVWRNNLSSCGRR